MRTPALVFKQSEIIIYGVQEIIDLTRPNLSTITPVSKRKSTKTSAGGRSLDAGNAIAALFDAIGMPHNIRPEEFLGRFVVAQNQSLLFLSLLESIRRLPELKQADGSDPRRHVYISIRNPIEDAVFLGAAKLCRYPYPSPMERASAQLEVGFTLSPDEQGTVLNAESVRAIVRKNSKRRLIIILDQSAAIVANAHSLGSVYASSDRDDPWISAINQVNAERDVQRGVPLLPAVLHGNEYPADWIMAICPEQFMPNESDGQLAFAVFGNSEFASRVQSIHDDSFGAVQSPVLNHNTELLRSFTEQGIHAEMAGTALANLEYLAQNRWFGHANGNRYQPQVATFSLEDLLLTDLLLRKSRYKVDRQNFLETGRLLLQRLPVLCGVKVLPDNASQFEPVQLRLNLHVPQHDFEEAVTRLTLCLFGDETQPGWLDEILSDATAVRHRLLEMDSTPKLASSSISPSTVKRFQAGHNNVAVVGAGVGGITTARALQDAGYHVLLYDSAISEQDFGNVAIGDNISSAAGGQELAWLHGMKRKRLGVFARWFRTSHGKMRALARVPDSGIAPMGYLEFSEQGSQWPEPLRFLSRSRTRIINISDSPIVETSDGRTTTAPVLEEWEDGYSINWLKFQLHLQREFLAHGGEFHQKKVTVTDLPKMGMPVVVVVGLNCEEFMGPEHGHKISYKNGFTLTFRPPHPVTSPYSLSGVDDLLCLFRGDEVVIGAPSYEGDRPSREEVAHLIHRVSQLVTAGKELRDYDGKLVIPQGSIPDDLFEGAIDSGKVRFAYRVLSEDGPIVERHQTISNAVVVAALEGAGLSLSLGIAPDVVKEVDNISKEMSRMTSPIGRVFEI